MSTEWGGGVKRYEKVTFELGSTEDQISWKKWGRDRRKVGELVSNSVTQQDRSRTSNFKTVTRDKTTSGGTGIE